MRYVSHEIRTPLNISILGLQHIKKHIKNHRLVDLYDILEQIETSWNTILSTVNDLSSFDMIEKGLLFLQRTEIRVWPFLNDILSPFHNQVRPSIDLYIYVY